MWSSSFLFPMLSLMAMFLILFMKFSLTSSWAVYVMEFEMDSFFLLDFVSITFIFTVSVVSVAVLYYSLWYMSSSLMKKKFILSLSMFIFSMFFLVLSSDLFWVMVGWDGLGLTSLYLIMFFQSWKSFNSSMVTFILNRLGDGFILLSLIWTMGVGLSKSPSLSSSFFYTFLILGALSKSAQFPFSAWLPLAMAAPTPVSSLVHSSTLVTAGVYLLIRFNSFFESWQSHLVFFISSLTIFLAGISSLGEYDLKKIIALSTLSHIGMMVMFVSSGFMFSALIHLFTHAMFKSLLFMISGVIIHNLNGNQDIRFISINSFDMMTGAGLVISLLSMIGIPFFSGFISKEFLLGKSTMSSFSLFFMFLFSASITASYSIRIMTNLFISKPSSFFLVNKSSKMVFFLMSLMALLSGAVLISIVEWSVEDSLVFSVLSTEMKKMVFIYIMFGLILGFFISFIQGNVPVMTMKWMNHMWFIHSFTHFCQYPLYKSSYFFWGKSDSKGLLDLLFFSLNETFKSLSKKSLTVFVPSPIFLMGLPMVVFIPMILVW